MNDSTIRQLAGAQSYQGGLDYFTNGYVASLEDCGDCVRATVHGSRAYKVTLTPDSEVPGYSCDCPVGSDGAFCKHCVAAALAWLNRRTDTRTLTLVDAEKILQSEDKDTLVSMVLDWAKDDDRLHERLILYAARRTGPDGAAAAVRIAFENAVRVYGYVGYREAASWARDVDDAIDLIEELLKDGHAAGVVDLCESALQLLLEAIQAVDDSDGHFSMLRDRLQGIHYRACQQAQPDPEELARRLFQWEMQSDFDIFYRAAAQYAKVLGANGLMVYRDLAETEWEKVPAQTASQDRSTWGEHFRITQIMESLAQAFGDIEQLVAVKSRDLTSAYHYLEIAEVYRKAHQHDNALLWAEKGLKAFPIHTDPRLREFVADEYHCRHRHDEAMNLMWAEFTEQPCLETYKTLERHAKTASTWPEWRERALTEIRSRIAKAKAKARSQTRPWWMSGDNDHSQLVEIFLFERDQELAWHEAQAGGCSDSLWLRLAAAREKTHPEDAAPIYLKQAEADVAGTSNGRYEDSIELLLKAATAMRRINRGAEFILRLDALRAKYKIKRNFIKLVEQNRTSLYGS